MEEMKYSLSLSLSSSLSLHGILSGEGLELNFFVHVVEFFLVEESLMFTVGS